MYNGAALPGTLARTLLDWYRTAARDLPWRRTRDPYRVLVSEVMLQQTQAARVAPAYERFIRRFPTLRSLGGASLGEVLREWRGLGYNRRARDLHRVARLHPRGLPRGTDALDALPGVGPYTAGAVACFAHRQRVAFADTNIRRVLGRIVLGRTATDAEAVALDRALLPRDAASWHHALMDLGATICAARAPRCGGCPVGSLCRAHGQAPVQPARRQAAFATSDRRIRGRIVALLRQRPMRVASLRTAIGDERVPRLIRALEAEGLVECARGVVRLPQ